MKIITNHCWGGFGLSDEAIKLFRKKKKMVKAETLYDGDIPRDDLDLVAVVEELGAKASGALALIKVTEIPDGTDWEISDYDGMEHVAEKHETW